MRIQHYAETGPRGLVYTFINGKYLCMSFQLSEGELWNIEFPEHWLKCGFDNVQLDEHGIPLASLYTEIFSVDYDEAILKFLKEKVFNL